MKNIVLVLFAAAAIALGGVAVVQQKKNVEQRQTIAALQADAQEKAQVIAELKSATEKAEARQRNLAQLAEDLGKEAKEARAAAETNASAAPPVALPAPPAAGTADKDAKGGFGKMLAGMMKDPQMKKFIREQQRTMMNQLYDPLIKRLGLSAEEAGQFKELLADNMMNSAEKATSLLGTAQGTNHTEMVQAMAADQKAFDEQVKAFLGEDRYAQYKEYQTTAGERTQLNLFKQQNAGSEHPLTDQQTEQLLALMKEEKQNAASQGGQVPSGMGNDSQSLQAVLSEEQGEKLIQTQTTINQRVLDRARGVLWPDQFTSFAQFQTNQLQMMRMGLSMARKLMTPDAGGTPSDEGAK